VLTAVPPRTTGPPTPRPATAGWYWPVVSASDVEVAESEAALLRGAISDLPASLVRGCRPVADARLTGLDVTGPAGIGAGHVVARCAWLIKILAC
jgi:hypothetical protein